MHIKTAKTVSSREAYFALDNNSNEKHEFYQGEILPCRAGRLTTLQLVQTSSPN
jgi:hypothetical protein